MNIPKEEIIRLRRLIEDSSVKKRIHYRDLHLEVDITNYQTCTKVDFKAVEDPNDNPHFTWYQLKEKFKGKITSEYESHKKSGSKYFTIGNGDVYRISNHWGCVKTCVWSREGEGNFIASLMLSGPVEIGVANISDFKVYRQKHEWRKDMIINPEWVEKITPLIPEIQNMVETLLEIKRSEEFTDMSSEDKFLIGTNFGKFRGDLKKINEDVDIKFELTELEKFYIKLINQVCLETKMNRKHHGFVSPLQELLDKVWGSHSWRPECAYRIKKPKALDLIQMEG